MKDTIIVDPENARVNRRVMNLLECNAEAMDDNELLGWARAINQELESQNANYQYLIMDNDEWIIADEYYLRRRGESLDMDDDVKIYQILELIAENQTNKSCFTLSCESDIRLDDCDVDEDISLDNEEYNKRRQELFDRVKHGSGSIEEIDQAMAALDGIFNSEEDV